MLLLIHIRQCNRIEYRKMLLLKFIIFLCLILQCASLSEGDSDWLQNCGPCHCNWNSGKKTADCKNRTIIRIPTFFNGELQVIDLSGNQISTISREEFFHASLENLHKIYMKNCSINNLHRDSFKGLAVLFELDLSNNYVKALPVGIFSSLQKLRNLRMNYNEIEILENSLFENMKFLSRVEFKHNRIKIIDVDVFVNVENLSLIYLESNRLTFLRKETFENIIKLKDLTLASNQWNCTCELQPFRDFIIKRNLYTPPTSCFEPPNVKDKLWTEVPVGNFACKPKIIQPKAESHIQANNDNITLICRVRGIPKPNVFWLFNKRLLNINEQRMQIRNEIDVFQNDYNHILISTLIITGLRSSDRGTYTCVAENGGGKDNENFILDINVDKLIDVPNIGPTTNFLFIVCLTVISLLLLLIIIVLVLCWYCRKVRYYSKDAAIREGSLISKKEEKTQSGSILEGSVIMEMQKNLLNEVNPVEKPPRRTEIENVETDEINETKKNLLEKTRFGSFDEDTNSALSDATLQSRGVYFDYSYGKNLPPDLLSFSAKLVPQSPSLQNSISNMQTDNRKVNRKSPLSSPIYQHVSKIEPTATTQTSIESSRNNGLSNANLTQFRTLQYFKNRNLAIVSMSPTNLTCGNKSQFVPAPIVYPSVIMKQGYMTIPRKPRTPSWTPTCTSPLSEFQSSSPIKNSNIIGTDLSASSNIEPIYDNLGLRTTAGGNSVLSLDKINDSKSFNNKIAYETFRYSMKNRPLPATPKVVNQDFNNSNIGANISCSINGFVNGKNNGLNSSNNDDCTNYKEILNMNINNNEKSFISDAYNINLQKGTMLYETIHETLESLKSKKQSLKENIGANILPSYPSTIKIGKIPPPPPPKPKNKINNNKLLPSAEKADTDNHFDDEGEDGTEV